VYFPVKDRTIWLSLENPAATTAGATGAALLSGVGPFVSQFLPANDLLAPFQGNVAEGGLTATQTLLQTQGAPLALTGPTSIDMAFKAGVADGSGIGTNFLQPWFIKNVPITIKGTSYLGDYPGLSQGDNDAQQILQMFRQSLNDFAENVNGAPGTGQRVILRMTNMPFGMDKFIGYITSFHPSEQIDTVFLINYTLEFIGKSLDNANILTGKNNASLAKAAFGLTQ
jgi:hypothetical protein